jgi:hypothetical protein
MTIDAFATATEMLAALRTRKVSAVELLDLHIFYSMATSSAEHVPRSLEFLFSRNRLNVAVSRAMRLAFVVASPRLLESRARGPLSP